ncbi:MAG: fibrillarin-like rRNA/tRNA 2'-O-methyltransferase [Methanomassiliicoccales archaeon]|nr:fibrillarin-like rRNA/tRNA 2'-O-methyltransferase [Methanomassiliicoccales archaeon]
MDEGRLVETRVKGVFWDGERLLTRNSAPGTRVYGERLFDFQGVEYREWSPSRSKLGAYLRLGGLSCPIGEGSRVLYLGAASGTTASHVADIACRGTVYCVEISPRSFRDLVKVCESRRNMVPVLGDATRPQEYSFLVERADVVYQDIAQKGQAAIFIKAMRAFGAGAGMLSIKARSEDVTREPSEVFQEAKGLLLREGLEVRDLMDLSPFEKDHAMIVVGRT